MTRYSLPAALAALVLMLAPVAHAAGGCAEPGDSSRLQAEVIAHVNAERAERGLPKLVLNPALDAAAQKHACDNAKRKSISHVSSDGGHLQNRLRRAGYRYSTASENTGRGFASGARAVEWWMDSPGHKKNILMGQTREIGVGIALSAAPDNKLHWIIVMGQQK